MRESMKEEFTERGQLIVIGTEKRARRAARTED